MMVSSSKCNEWMMLKEVERLGCKEAFGEVSAEERRAGSGIALVGDTRKLGLGESRDVGILGK